MSLHAWIKVDTDDPFERWFELAWLAVVLAAWLAIAPWRDDWGQDIGDKIFFAER